MDIVCRRMSCKYNDRLACTAKRINIDNKLNCLCYEPGNNDNVQDMSKNMFDIVPDVAPFKHNLDIKIKCDAPCLMNNCHECMANGIFLNKSTDSDPVVCFTFINK